MIFDIFNNSAFVDIKSVGKFLKKHILCKTKIILVRETQLFPAFGKLHAELVEGDDQEFNAILVTPEPDEGYELKALYANGSQVAINDKDEYLIAYNGEKIILSAEFVEIQKTPETPKKDSVPNTGSAAAGFGIGAAAVAAAAIVISKKRK